MSRIGKLIIKVPLDVEVIYLNSEIRISGPLGKLTQRIPNLLKIQYYNRTLSISPKRNDRRSLELHGLYRSLIYNMVIGVSKNFTITLMLQGVGYRAVREQNTLILYLGYSHTIKLKIPKEISLVVTKNTSVKIISCNKSKLGLFASKIRSFRPPEPYKGKGIKYENEVVRRKIGKSGKK
jgi:large subunit ribosomal protein L6